MEESRSARIRLAGAEDAEAIARVRVETWRAAYAGIMPADFLASISVETDTPRWRQRIEEGPQSGSFVLVAEVDGEVVGFASSGPERGSHLPGGDLRPLRPAGVSAARDRAEAGGRRRPEAAAGRDLWPVDPCARGQPSGPALLRAAGRAAGAGRRDRNRGRPAGPGGLRVARSPRPGGDERLVKTYGRAG
jgi:hypothetical protein